MRPGQRSGRLLLGAAAAFLAALLQPRSDASAADTLRVGTPLPGDFVYTMLDIGVAEGLFQRQSLDIDSIVLGGGGKLHQAMVAGSLDLGLEGGPGFAFIAKGAPEKAVAAIAGAPADMAITVGPNSKIHAIADLRHTTISVSSPGSLTAWFVSEIVRREGWSAGDMTQVYTGGTGAAAALISGNVDAISGSVQNGLQLEEAGKGKILLSLGDFVHPFIAHVIYASDDIMRRNPDAIRRFIKGWFDTIRFMKQHKEEAVRDSRRFTELSQPVTEKLYDAEMPMFFTDGHFDPKAVAVVMQSLLDMGLITKVPDDETLYTEEYLP
jgi:NitT/TauT family transport system substrate-binding protein